MTVQTPEEKKAYQRQWYLAHQETERAKARERAAARRAEGNAPTKTPEQRHQAWVKWYAKNRERRLAYMAAMPAEAKRAAGKRSRERHAGRYRRRMIERYHQRRASGTVATRDWDRLVARHQGRCAYCGWAGKLTEDHVVPLSRGGRHTIGNLLPACGSCNSSKGGRFLVEWRRPGTGKRALRNSASGHFGMGTSAVPPLPARL